VELPTYTSIWRIEKRLYKLYDFRLPMPLPVGQIAVFTAITVPYVVLLTLLGVPFNHSLFWLYVLPPGLLTWLATRPVLESKRLPELLISQARYVGEPSTWCRMAPLAEKDQVVVFSRVWRRASVAPAAEAAQAGIAAAEQDQAVAELPVTERSALPVATPVARPVAAHADATDTVPARRTRGRQARGQLVRERQAPERLAPEATTGPVGPAGRRAAGEPLGTCGGHVAPDTGTGASGWARRGQDAGLGLGAGRRKGAGRWKSAGAGWGGARRASCWRRLGQGRDRRNLAGSRPGGNGWPGTSRGARQAVRPGRATRAGRLRRVARASWHERPGHQWPRCWRPRHRRRGPAVRGSGDRQ